MRTHLTLTSYCNQNRSTAPQFSPQFRHRSTSTLSPSLSLSLPRLTEA
jgi:hypothetical protein